MNHETFFDEPTEESEVKIKIVTTYFGAWANVMLRTVKGEIAYVDLFAGMGRYKDGSESTPILVLKKAIARPDLQRRLITVFNDKDYAAQLKEVVGSIPGVQQLDHHPRIYDKTVGEQILALLNDLKGIPKLFFVEPWGYKGVSLTLIGSLIRDFGSDCIMFFNYARVNPGLNNERFKEHMDSLFGENNAFMLRFNLDYARFDSHERELAIIEAMMDAIQEVGGKYVLPFTFKRADGTRTSHHLIFVSKHSLGYEIMKNIMAKESSDSEQGVPTFAYNRADKQQPKLFDLSRPLEDLESMVLTEFRGQELLMEEVYRHHNVGKRFIESNYRDVLLKLESEGRVMTSPTKDKRRKNMWKKVRVSFPNK